MLLAKSFGWAKASSNNKRLVIRAAQAEVSFVDFVTPGCDGLHRSNPSQRIPAAHQGEKKASNVLMSLTQAQQQCATTLQGLILELLRLCQKGQRPQVDAQLFLDRPQLPSSTIFSCHIHKPLGPKKDSYAMQSKCHKIPTNRWSCQRPQRAQFRHCQTYSLHLAERNWAFTTIVTQVCNWSQL